ncbi:MAG: hypothetical protein OHK0048_00050 [Rhodoferax sp.]
MLVFTGAVAQTSWSSNPRSPEWQHTPQQKGVYQTQRAPCPRCGRVTAVTQRAPAPQAPSPATATAMASALAGQQAAQGAGLGAVAQAAAVGSVAAGVVDQALRPAVVWVVSVRYDDGTDEEVTYSRDPGFRVGEAVRKVGESLAHD